MKRKKIEAPVEIEAHEDPYIMNEVRLKKLFDKDGHPTLARIIVAANNKGGCSKTTSLEALGTLCTKEGKKVLYIDMDQQGNCTARVNPNRVGGNIQLALQGLNDQFKWDVYQFAKCIVGCKVKAIKSPVYIVSGTPAIEDLITSILVTKGKGMMEMRSHLHRALEFLRPYFDYILIDTPPSVDTLLMEFVMLAVDTVIIPIDSLDALEGAATLLECVQAQNQDREGSRDLVRVFPYCTHMVGDPNKSAWFKLYLQFFPIHSAKHFVKHTSNMQGTVGPGCMLSGMSSKARKEYKELHKELFKGLMLDTSILPLTEWMDKSGTTRKDLLKKILEERFRQGRDVQTFTVSFDESDDV